MLTALRTKESEDNDRIKATKDAKGYCIFCRKPICARERHDFYEFYCGCKEERKYYRTS